MPSPTSGSKSESDDFVLFNSSEGIGALVANVLCDIPILRIRLIRKFGSLVISCFRCFQCRGKLLLKVMCYNIPLLSKKVTNYVT